MVGVRTKKCLTHALGTLLGFDCGDPWGSQNVLVALELTQRRGRLQVRVTWFLPLWTETVVKRLPSNFEAWNVLRLKCLANVRFYYSVNNGKMQSIAENHLIWIKSSDFSLFSLCERDIVTDLVYDCFPLHPCLSSVTPLIRFCLPLCLSVKKDFLERNHSARLRRIMAIRSPVQAHFL